jgi:hypothetical protein
MFIYFDNKWNKYLKYSVFLSKCIPCHISDCDLIIFILYHVFVYQYILCLYIGQFS